MDKEKKYNVAMQDPRYNDQVIVKFVNRLMQGGKKSTARKELYNAFDIIKERKKEDPLEVFHQAIRNVSPRLEIVSRRIGGAHYQIPKKVHGDRRETLAIRWLLEATKNNNGPIAKKLADEIIKAAERQGEAINKRKNVHRMAEANKAFAHLAW